MDRITDLLLRVGLLLASVGSVYELVIMITAQVVPVEWNRYNALTFFSAALFLAAARAIEGSIRARGSQPAVER